MLSPHQEDQDSTNFATLTGKSLEGRAQGLYLCLIGCTQAMSHHLTSCTYQWSMRWGHRLTHEGPEFTRDLHHRYTVGEREVLWTYHVTHI
ncbi:hypothetical protein FKM82_026475 [Ascaphus truei]